MRELTWEETLRYEVRASWWTQYVTWEPLQAVAAAYFRWKVGRKWRRYHLSMEEGRRVGVLR